MRGFEKYFYRLLSDEDSVSVAGEMFGKMVDTMGPIIALDKFATTVCTGFKQEKN